MTAPTSAPTSYEQALLLAEQLVAARGAGSDPVATAATMSERIIATRENTAAWAKTAIRRLWATVNPYDPKQVEAFTVEAARLMESAQTAVARMAAAGQAQQLAAMGIPVDAVPSNPVDVRGAAAVVRKGQMLLERQSFGVDYGGKDGDVRVSKKDMAALGVLARPGMVYRYAKSQGASDSVAAGLAAGRIDDLVDNNLMLAQRIAEQESLVQAVDLDTGKTRNGIVVIGYRRIIHPELSRTGTCGMCIAASDRIYNVGKLLPIHDKCKCTIAAVTEDYDPADDLNTVDLAQLYKDAGGTSVAHLKRTRYKEDIHGELGPVLVPKSTYKPRSTKSKVRVGGTALQSDQPAQAEVAKQQLRVMEESLAKLRSDGEPEDSSKIAYHEKLIAKLRKQADEDDSEPRAGGGGGGGEPPSRPPVGGGDGSDDSDDPRFTEAVRNHILDGDHRGGGHRSTSTEPGKTLFPEWWTDDDVIAALSKTLAEPYTTSDDHEHLVDPNFLNLYGFVDGVRLVVRMRKADGTVDTGHALDGHGVFRNGKKAGTAKKQLPLGSVRNVPLPHELDRPR